MASYTYSLIDSGDGAVATYFGTASMSAINASQSADFDDTYVEKNMYIDASLLEHSDYYDENTTKEISYYPHNGSYNVTYTFPDNINTGNNTNATDIFHWSYYSIVNIWSYSSLLDTGFYISGSSTIDPEDTELSAWDMQEEYQLSLDKYNEIPNDAMTIVLYNNGTTETSQGMWGFDVESAGARYQNLGISDPQVSMTTDENGDDSYSYTYISGELAGIRTKFASPAGSTSLSLMQAVISSSVGKIYNTSNISRFNFKKTRAEALKPREVSSIDLVKDFNRPYRGTTSGY